MLYYIYNNADFVVLKSKCKNRHTKKNLLQTHQGFKAVFLSYNKRWKAEVICQVLSKNKWCMEMNLLIDTASHTAWPCNL